jgi:hypothetical protein
VAKKKTDERPVRGCDICRIADTDPRHVVDIGDSNQVRHLDCCREAGCPDGSCDEVTRGVEDLRGAELLAHLTGD